LFLLGLRRRRPEAAPADAHFPTGPITPWTPTPYGAAPTGPPPPPQHPGYRIEDVPQAPVMPGQPPIRLPDQPTGGGFAPPSVVPPPPPSNAPPPPPSKAGWSAFPEDDDD
jgi:hypothetical protein